MNYKSGRVIELKTKEKNRAGGRKENKFREKEGAKA